jgi:uncharacterized protein YuzE
MTVLYKRRPQREAKAMTDITYDVEADAVYITIGRGKFHRTEETGPFIYDVDAEGHILGIEILSPARSWRPEAGKKQGHQVKRTSDPWNSGLDLRDPQILAEIRREAAIMALHPENDAIDEWIEAVNDWSVWEEWRGD